MDTLINILAYIAIVTVVPALWRKWNRQEARPVKVITEAPALPSPECWSILGIEPTASKMEIKRAYRRLMKEHHPDISGDNEKCHEIKEAYQKALSEVSAS